MKRALVFSGGGAKGAYQVGVWKALRKLNMKFDIVTGTSIGAINAGMFAMDKYYLAKRMWMKIKNSDLFDIPNDLSGSEMYFYLFKSFFKNGGLSFDKADAFLRKEISEKKIRKSKVDFGIVTYSIKNKQPKMLRVDDIPNGKLVDYIIASSTCFPAVATKKIDNDVFIDGGFYDNLPVNLAVEMGASEIVAIDLSVLAFDKPVKDKSVKVDVIKCQDNTKFTINFSRDYSKKMFLLGYNDTMKYFKKLDGNNYTFYEGEIFKNYEHLEKNFINVFTSIIFLENKGVISKEIFKISKFKTLFENIRLKRNISDDILFSMEYLAFLFDIDNTKIYKANDFNRILLRCVKKLSNFEFNKTLKGKFLIGYIYNKYLNASNLESISKEMFNIALIFPKDFLAAIYLITISKKYPLFLKTEEYYDKVISFLKND